MRDFGKILIKVAVTRFFSAIGNCWFIIDFTFSRVSTNFSFHLKVVKQIWIEKSVPNIAQKVLMKIDFDNVCSTQALSCSFTGIVSINLVVLIGAYF